MKPGYIFESILYHLLSMGCGTLRQLADSIGSTKRGVGLVLTKMQRQGLVHQVDVPNATCSAARLYSLTHPGIDQARSVDIADVEFAADHPQCPYRAKPQPALPASGVHALPPITEQQIPPQFDMLGDHARQHALAVVQLSQRITSVLNQQEQPVKVVLDALLTCYVNGVQAYGLTEALAPALEQLAAHWRSPQAGGQPVTPTPARPAFLMATPGQTH